MKPVIKSQKYNASSNDDNQFILKCACSGCGLLEFRQCSDGDVNILFYSTSNLKKRDKHAWDILLDADQAKELVANLQEMINKSTENKCSKEKYNDIKASDTEVS